MLKFKNIKFNEFDNLKIFRLTNLLMIAHDETKPAGIMEVIVSKVWKPSSSGGIPNSVSLAS